jgi:hypothetical protein
MPHNLSVAQHRTLAALAEALAPASPHLPLSATEAGVADSLDALLDRFDATPRRLLKLLVTALRFAPVLKGKGATFPKLDSERREAYLREALAQPRWDHDVVVNLRALCDMVYAGDPRFRRHVGDFNEPYKTGVPVPPETELRVIHHPELRASTSVDCDVVIVGSGAGGSIIARELAHAGIDVVVVEEGGPVSREDFEDRPLHRVVKYYRANGLTATRGTPVIPVPMGRVVGGTPVVNSGTCLRAPDSVLQEWAEIHGAALAAPDALGQAYEDVAAQLSIQPVTEDIMGNNGRIVRRGAEELKLRAQPIPRPVRDCVGTGQCGFGCPRDAKQSMHLTYLPDAVRRGARIYGLCKVDRLLIEGRRVTGVVASILDEQRRATGQSLTVRARAVFLCAGAIHTPALLLRHGLGRGSRAVGRHLRIHPASGVTGKFEETVNGWQGVMQPFAIEEYVSEGILLEAVFPPLGMTYSSAALPGVGEEHAALLADYPHMASIGSVVSDTGSGRVRSVPGGSPIMLYRMSPLDVRRAVRAISLGARVLFAAGALEVYPGVPAVPVLRSLGEVDDFEKGRVHDVDNLYVGDTSLFPGSPHANPQFTLMALCRNLAHRFAEGWPQITQSS